MTHALDLLYFAGQKLRARHRRQLVSMFISPALEELTETEQPSGTNTLRAVSSSVHGPPSGQGEHTADMTAKGSSDFDGFKRDLTRQLVSVDQQTFQRVKQAIRSALDSQSASSDPSSVIQVEHHTTYTAHADQQCNSMALYCCLYWNAVVFDYYVTKICEHTKPVKNFKTYLQDAQHRVHEVLHNSAADGKEESKSYYATVADAVTSAGTAIGHLSSQVFGGPEVRRQFLVLPSRCLVTCVKQRAPCTKPCSWV